MNVKHFKLKPILIIWSSNTIIIVTNSFLSFSILSCNFSKLALEYLHYIESYQHTLRKAFSIDQFDWLFTKLFAVAVLEIAPGNLILFWKRHSNKLAVDGCNAKFANHPTLKRRFLCMCNELTEPQWNRIDHTSGSEV